MSEQEFNDIVANQRERLMGIAMSYLKDAEEAADAVQEALVNLWLFRTRVNEWRNTSALLTTITKNICLMHLRKERNTTEQLNISIPATDNPHHDLEARERAEIVKDVMNHLPPPYQAVLQMHYSAELSIQQIANIRNTTPNAVKQMLLRARTALRAEIERRNP